MGASHSPLGESEILTIIDCGQQTSQVVVVPFELMAFPLASKETEVTGLSDMPEVMTGVSLRAGKEGILVPNFTPYAISLGEDIAW